MITALFQVTGLIVIKEAHSLDPLGRLPGVELGNDQTHRSAMVRRNRCTVVRPGKQRILIKKIFNRNVGGPTRVVSKRNDEPELASRPFDQSRDGFFEQESAGKQALGSDNRRHGQFWRQIREDAGDAQFALNRH